jgi:GT2 family glycosyltransferase
MAANRYDSVALSIIIPFYEDPAEAAALARLTHEQLSSDITAEWILVALDPDKLEPSGWNSEIPSNTKILVCEKFAGLPQGKNLALQACAGRLVLFLMPGLRPAEGAIVRLKTTLEGDASCAAVAGRWENKNGVIEKGYNLRRFPTFAALVFDLLLINKLMPWNPITRRYKMHDFDHRTPCNAEHANDVNFMARTDLLLNIGGFNERFGMVWFDQVDICRNLRRQNFSVCFQPNALFMSTDKEPLVNRIVADHYARYYRDELQFVEREFGRGFGWLFRLVLLTGMAIRIAFVSLLTSRLRRVLLAKYRSYVSEEYVLKMKSSYIELLRSVITGRGNE